MVIQIFVLSCSVHYVLLVLHNQCLITACLMRGLQFSPKRCKIGDFFFLEITSAIMVRKEETAEFACLETAEVDSS